MGEKRGERNQEFGIDIYTLLPIKQITNENLLSSTGNFSMLCDDLNGKEMQKRGDTHIHIAD